MDEHNHLPEINQLSVLLSTILLAYALTPFINLSVANFNVRLPFGVFTFTINFLTIVSILVAALAGFGINWLIHSHPHPQQKVRIQYSLLPAMTAWVIGIPLNTLSYGVGWWVLFALGGVLLALVFVAEYIAVDFSDTRFGPAVGGLLALSLALFLILSITIRAAGLRLYLALPGLAILIFMISLRTLYLRSSGRWNWVAALCISLVTVQIAVALQYLPVSPLGYGLYLVAPVYAMISLAVVVDERRPLRPALAEPVIIMVILLILAFLFGG